MQATITSTAQQLTQLRIGQLSVQNVGSVPVFVGPTAAVTATGTTGGIRLESGEFIDPWGRVAGPEDGPWVVCAGGQTSTVAYGMIDMPEEIDTGFWGPRYSS